MGTANITDSVINKNVVNSKQWRKGDTFNKQC